MEEEEEDIISYFLVLIILVREIYLRSIWYRKELKLFLRPTFMAGKITIFTAPLFNVCYTYQEMHMWPLKVAQTSE